MISTDPKNEGKSQDGGTIPPQDNVRSVTWLAPWLILAIVFIGSTAFVLVSFLDKPKSAESNPERDLYQIYGISPAAFQEWKAARADHEAVAFAIAQCHDLGDMYAQPGFMQLQLMLGLEPNGFHKINP